MDQDTITISIRRDAAFYLSMLLGDQIFNITDCKVTCQLEEMLTAYEHAKEHIERALKRHPLSPGSAESAGNIGEHLQAVAAD